MKAAIILMGITGVDKPNQVKVLEFDKIQVLKDELRKLQKGYLVDGKDRVKITEEKKVIDGNKYHFVFAESMADFHHVASIGSDFKQ